MPLVFFQKLYNNSRYQKGTMQIKVVGRAGMEDTFLRVTSGAQLVDLCDLILQAEVVILGLTDVFFSKHFLASVDNV